jgi:hypothetical protein
MAETCEELCELPVAGTRGPRYEIGRDFDAAGISKHLGREPTLLVFLRHFG